MDDNRRQSTQSLVAEISELSATIAMLESRLLEKRMAEGNAHRPGGEAGRLLGFAPFAVENLSDGTYLISREARVIYVNNAACSMLGYTKAEMLNMSMLEINPTLTREIWDAVWAITVRDKKQTIESEHTTKDGRRIPVEILANYIEFDGVPYSCAFSRDITERRKMERRMRQSEKMEAIGQLAGGIAHDFNNQLAGIVGYADILSDELADRPDLARFAEAILTAAKRSSGLTEQLLAFARQGKFLSAPVDLHQIVGEVVHMLERSIDKRIRIKTRLEAAPPVTVGDPAQLQNAVLNLAINARDAMPDGGDLVLSTKIIDLDEEYRARSPYLLKPGRYVQLGVADTGAGMDAETESRIFEPFFTTKPKGKGTGMGLAAVYGTVKNHNGAINVYSEVGRGTEIHLYLPLAADLDTGANSTDTSSPPPNIAARVLLVEDEAAVREVTAEMLTRLGCQVTTAQNGKEAIAIYQKLFSAIDVVILDLVMPEMGGKDTFIQMRAINPDVRTIVASGYSLDGEVQGILDQGAKGFIQKPFRAGALAKMISDILGNERRP